MALKVDWTALATKNPLVRACSDETRAALSEYGQLYTFRTGQVLFHEGEPAGIVIFPLSGVLQMSKTAARGRRQVLCTINATECGGICLLMMADQGIADVQALDAGQMVVLDRETFQGLARRDPVLCQTAWGAASECMAHLGGLVSALSFHKVVERVALMLLENTEEDGGLVRVTQAELAAEVGTMREVVARCLAGLQSSGVVRLGRGRITVLNREKLRKQAEESDRAQAGSVSARESRP